jgi:hypothetical protein
MDYNVCHAGVIIENRIENCLTGGHIKGGASDINHGAQFFYKCFAGQLGSI